MSNQNTGGGGRNARGENAAPQALAASDVDNEILVAALDYAERGWPVFPVRGKVPLTRRGFQDATTGAGQVRSWWGTRPETGIGIATGRASGLVVLDVDPVHHGDHQLADWQARHSKLPPTPCVATGGGGQHFYFRA